METESERVCKDRGMVLALLRKRAPDSQRIAALCRIYKAPELPRLSAADAGKCILCGLCVRACTELSVGAISTVNRGVLKEKAIPIAETADTRVIWDKTFQLVHCAQCGSVIGTREELEMAAKRSGQELEALCDRCRKAATAQILANVYGK